jgi:hypothetical protein
MKQGTEECHNLYLEIYIIYYCDTLEKCEIQNFSLKTERNRPIEKRRMNMILLKQNRL